MKRYREFCDHYQLDPDHEKSKQDYAMYLENLGALKAAAAKHGDSHQQGHRVSH